MRLDGPDRALALLDDLTEQATAYQPWYAVRAEALTRSGRVELARSAYERASALTDDHAVRAFLQARRHLLR